MRIISIETIPVRMPRLTHRAIRSSLGHSTTSTFVLLKVVTDEGLIGLGEVSCDPVWSGEDYVTSKHYVDEVLSPLLVGEDPLQIEAAMLRLNRKLAGNPFTKAGIEMALWDLLGKAAGLPLYQLLGGAVREHVTTKFSVSGSEPMHAAEIAAWAVSEGFRAMKVKVGIDREQDIVRVRTVREAIGPEIRLGIDANGGWSTRVAIDMIRRLTDFGIIFAEQPVPAHDVAWMADVRRHVTVPIMADESLFTLQDAVSLVRAQAADIFSLYVGKGGGIGTARKIAAVAEAAGLTCTIGSNLELGIATAAMIHLGMATRGVGAEEFPCDIIGPYYYETDLLTEPLLRKGGEARPTGKPGLGVELDDEKVERYRVK